MDQIFQSIKIKNVAALKIRTWRCFWPSRTISFDLQPFFLMPNISDPTLQQCIMLCNAKVVSAFVRDNEEGVPNAWCCMDTSSSSNTPSCKKIQLTSWFINYYTFVVNIMPHKLLDVSRTHGSLGETSRENYKSFFCSEHYNLLQVFLRYYGNKLWTCNLIETELRFFWIFGRLCELRPHKPPARHVWEKRDRK